MSNTNTAEVNQINKTSRASLLKTNTNYITIEFGYSLKVVLPHKEASQIIALLDSAKLVSSKDYSNPKITPLKASDNFKIELLSQPDYLRYKLAHLLGIPSGDIDETNLIGLQK